MYASGRHVIALRFWKVAAWWLLATLVLASTAVPQALDLKFCGTIAPPESGSDGAIVEPPVGLKFCGMVIPPGFDHDGVQTAVQKGCGGTWSNGRCKGFPRDC